MGDPACWLGAVCLSCGRVVENDESGACPACGWEFPEELEPGHDASDPTGTASSDDR